MATLWGGAPFWPLASGAARRGARPASAYSAPRYEQPSNSCSLPRGLCDLARTWTGYCHRLSASIGYGIKRFARGQAFLTSALVRRPRTRGAPPQPLVSFVGVSGSPPPSLRSPTAAGNGIAATNMPLRASRAGSCRTQIRYCCELGSSSCQAMRS